MKTIVIAEAGVNHNGNIKIAKKLVDAAALAKADYVKFQAYDADSLILKNTRTADYQKKNLGSKISQHKMFCILKMKKELNLMVKQRL